MLRGELSTADWDHALVRSWPDSDLAGDYMTSKSTAGHFLELAGLGDRGFPITWSCRTTGESAEHTQEAETLALSYSTKYDAIPVQMFLSKLMGRALPLEVMEDNAASITAAQKGYSPSLRHLPRTQRTSVGAVHEMFFWNEEDEEELANLRFWGHLMEPKLDNDVPVGLISLLKVDTKIHKGNFFTKTLTPMAFRQGLELLRVSKL